MRSKGCATSVDNRPAIRPEMVSTRTGGIPFWGVSLMRAILPSPLTRSLGARGKRARGPVIMGLGRAFPR